MLTFYGSGHRGPVAVAQDAKTLPDGVNWVDALDPTPEERAHLEHLMGVAIPSLEDLLEIETSSRLAVDGDTIVMSLPGMVKDAKGYPKSTPVGFVVTSERAVTVRFAKLPSFEHLSRETCNKGALSEGGLGATVSLIEILIDHIADLLEHVGDDLDNMSRSIFSGPLTSDKGRRPRQANQLLFELLRSVGRIADVLSKASQTLLGLSRMTPFLVAKTPHMMTDDFKTRLETAANDTKSLHEFQDHLSDKTQFLLDTILGLTNIEQNNVFRVLTVASVIGIPPTFVASMYGMNFKTMPELDWPHGYAYGLTVIAISAIVPAVWFKVKGWW